MFDCCDRAHFLRRECLGLIFECRYYNLCEIPMIADLGAGFISKKELSIMCATFKFHPGLGNILLVVSGILDVAN